MKNYNTPSPEVLASPCVAALYYLEELGWTPIPVGPEKKALLPWKKFQKELPTKDDIAIWYKKWPTAGGAVLTGSFSGLVVMDVDRGRSGLDTLKELLKNGTLSDNDLATPRAGTQSGGGHVYYAHPGGQVPNCVDLWPGIDIRGDGGYAVAPPTVFPAGKYKWTAGHAPWEIGLAKCPGALLSRIEAKDHSQAKLSETKLSVLMLPQPEGRRTDTLKRLVGHYCAFKLPRAEVLQVLTWWNEKNLPPLDDEEFHQQFEQMWKKWGTGKPHATTFALTPVSQLLEEPPEDMNWIWDQTLPAGGLSVLAAKPKVGKSTLAQNLCLGVARGAPFAGRDTTPGAVIYLALEDKRPEIAERFRLMGATTEAIFVHTGVAPEDGMKALEAAIDEHHAVLAVVDTLFKLVRIGNGNDYAEVTQKLDPLLQLARTTGCHVMAVHHLGKGDRDGGDAILGSTALFASVDTALLMYRKWGRRTIESQQRYGTDIAETVLALDSGTYLLEAAGTLENFLRKEAEGTILAALAKSPMPQKQIREIEGFKTKTLVDALSAVMQSGQVVRFGGGKKGDPYVYEINKSWPNGTKGETFVGNQYLTV